MQFPSPRVLGLQRQMEAERSFFHVSTYLDESPSYDGFQCFPLDGEQGRVCSMIREEIGYGPQNASNTFRALQECIVQSPRPLLQGNRRDGESHKNREVVRPDRNFNVTFRGQSK